MGEQMSTEYRQVGRHLVVETRVNCADGLTLFYKTLWTISNDRLQIVRERAELGLGAISMNLASGPTPIDHVMAVRAFAATQSGGKMNVDERLADIPEDFRTVFLATREEGCEVFADELSARFWAGTPSDIKNISLRAASSALKTDEATIVESAVAATRTTWHEMRVGVSLLHAAESLQARFRAAGISMDLLETNTASSSEPLRFE